MNTDSRFLHDHFNGNSILLIHSMEAHDIYVETLNLTGQSFGPPIRVYNWAGSGNVKSVALYEYLLALHTHYGDREGISPELSLELPVIIKENSRAYVIRDLPDEPYYMRITDEKDFLGFQTYCEDASAASYGPLVRIPKSLPLVTRQARALADMVPLGLDTREPV